MKLITRFLLAQGFLLASACAPQDYSFSPAGTGRIGGIEEGQDDVNMDPLPPQSPDDGLAPRRPGPPLENVRNNPDLLNQYRCPANMLESGEAGGRKVLICHYPPGNPAARHELCIGYPAVNAHLTHHDRGEDAHDTLGACGTEDDSDDDDDMTAQ